MYYVKSTDLYIVASLLPCPLAEKNFCYPPRQLLLSCKLAIRSDTLRSCGEPHQAYVSPELLEVYLPRRKLVETIT